MIRVNTKPRHKNAPRPLEKSAPGYLQWLRGRECLFAYAGNCSGKIEAMHLDFAGDKGMSTKVSDRFAVPGCSYHHSLQHRIGWPEFVAALATSKDHLLRAADKLWHLWPGRIAHERKLAELGKGS